MLRPRRGDIDRTLPEKARIHGRRWDDGIECSVCIAVAALAIAATGPGRPALDRFFRWGERDWAEAPSESVTPPPPSSSRREAAVGRR